jgi:membrane-associated phospholipid phosphatase
MNTSQTNVKHSDRAVWTIIAAMAAFDLIAVVNGTFTIAWPTFLVPLATFTGLAAAGWFYRAIRQDNRAAGLLTATAQIIAFSTVGAPMSYAAARAGFPLQDALLAGWDRHLGIDWPAYMTFVTSHAWLHRLLDFAYASFTVQVITTVLALGFAGHLLRLNIFVWSFVLTTLITIGISAFIPAVGPWLFYNIQPDAAHGALPLSSTSWPVFLGIRDGTFNVMSGLNSEGIITFPSLHAALGVLFMTALWRVRGLRWIALALNTLMILATPFSGSHYGVDVIAGIAIAIACWSAVRWMLRTSRIDSAALPPIPDTPSIVPDIVRSGMTATPSLDLDPRQFESRANVTQEH